MIPDPPASKQQVSNKSSLKAHAAHKTPSGQTQGGNSREKGSEAATTDRTNLGGHRFLTSKALSSSEEM